MGRHADTDGYRDALRIEVLDLEALPEATLSRILLLLVRDGLGRHIRLPILVAKGRRPGPVFGITAAVHGNELNGIPVIHRLMQWLDLEALRGTVVGVVAVNVPAVIGRRRDLEEGRDLNHLMPGRPDGNTAEVYAHRFVEKVLRQFDFVVDLHTASAGRANSLYVRADMTNEVTARMAYLQRPQIIVHNPPSDGTLRGTAMDLGIPAITVEIGDPQSFQDRYIRSAMTGLRSVLSDVEMIHHRNPNPGPPPVLCERSFWLYTDFGGLLEVVPDLCAEVKKGEIVARVHDVFGDVAREYVAPEDAVVVGRSTDPIGQTGARILHLGIPAPADDPRFVHRADDVEEE